MFNFTLNCTLDAKSRREGKEWNMICKVQSAVLKTVLRHNDNYRWVSSGMKSRSEAGREEEIGSITHFLPWGQNVTLGPECYKSSSLLCFYSCQILPSRQPLCRTLAVNIFNELLHRHWLIEHLSWQNDWGDMFIRTRRSFEMFLTEKAHQVGCVTLWNDSKQGTCQPELVWCK